MGKKSKNKKKKASASSNGTPPHTANPDTREYLKKLQRMMDTPVGPNETAIFDHSNCDGEGMPHKSVIKRAPACDRADDAPRGTDGTANPIDREITELKTEGTANSTERPNKGSLDPKGGVTRPLYGYGPHPGSRPPIEPGRKAIIRDLVSRTDLNDQMATILKILDSGRVAVEVSWLKGSEFKKSETFKIKPENLDVQWNESNNGGDNNVTLQGIPKEECPMCLDTIMIGNENAGYFECCGKRICMECFVHTQQNGQLKNVKDRCPFCRADTSDTSYQAAVKRFRARASRGDANAMYNLGGIYDSGLYGVEQDQAVARVWYQKGAAKGDARSAHNLGCSHRDGDGGPVNLKQAAKYFRIAAENGHIHSATNLGIAYMRGDGVDRDLDEAKKWLSKGAAAGDELAVQQLQFLDMMKSTMGLGGNWTSSPGNFTFSFGGR